MARFFSILVLAAATLVFTISVFLHLSRPKLAQRVATSVSTEPKDRVEIYKDEDGRPKFAQGTCQDNDCTPAGCGQEICSDDPTLITACILNPDAPDPDVYTCGCVEGKCVWYRK